MQALKRYPQLKQRIGHLLAVVEDAEGDLARADAAERRVIEEIRRLGQESLQAWAERQVEQTSVTAAETGEGRSGGKKTLLVQHVRLDRGGGDAVASGDAHAAVFFAQCAGEESVLFAAAATGDHGLRRRCRVSASRQEA